MQHETWCKNHVPPIDDTQAWTPCTGLPDAQARPPDDGGRITEAWLTTDEAGQTVVQIAHDERQAIPVQSAGEFGLQMALMAEKGGAVLKWPDVPPPRHGES